MSHGTDGFRLEGGTLRIDDAAVFETFRDGAAAVVASRDETVRDRWMQATLAVPVLE